MDLICVDDNERVSLMISKKRKRKKELNLNDMVLEANTFFLLSAPVFDIQYTDKVSCPATHQTIEYLE